MPGVAKFEEYLRNLKSPDEFDGVKLKRIMESFQASFGHHMRSEVTTIANLALHARAPPTGSKKEADTRSTFEAREGKAMMFSGVSDVVPFFLFNHDLEYEGGLWANWPPIPPPVRWFIMTLAKFRHPGWWKFASCDGGKLRVPLYAVPRERELAWGE